MISFSSFLDSIRAVHPVMMCILIYGVCLLGYTIYRYRRDSKSGAVENKALLHSYLGGKSKFDTERTLAESIPTSRINDIYYMTDTKAKGDALEDLTKEIYHILGYKAKTVREMKANGELKEMKGTDQGGDVIAVLYNEKKEVVERLLIQCKAYKYLDDAGGNEAVHKTNSAKDYYEDLMGVPFDRAILITTSPKLTVAARDAANRLGVEIIDNDQSLDSKKIPKSKLFALVKKANTRLYHRSLKAQ
ncbi:MAG: restriction endonuclease [Bdellovibrionaceae bacterium]|nr:restriction endonuclease [Pseudobdellovibrionaceae bacterium]